MSAKASSTGITMLPTQELILDRGRNLHLEQIHGLIGIEDDDTALVGPSDLEVALAHSAVEREIHLLERVEAPVSDPRHAHGRIEIQEQREVRDQPSGRQRIEI